MTTSRCPRTTKRRQQNGEDSGRRLGDSKKKAMHNTTACPIGRWEIWKMAVAAVRADPGGLCTIHFSVGPLLGRPASVGPGLQNWLQLGRDEQVLPLPFAAATPLPVQSREAPRTTGRLKTGSAASVLSLVEICCASLSSSYLLCPRLFPECMYTIPHNHQAAYQTLQGSVSNRTRTPSQADTCPAAWNPESMA
jgi:hypothetical protein